jgi:SAM-dependent methyltransferase
MTKTSVVAWIDSRWYPAHPSNWDSLALRRLVLARLKPEHDVLDFGAGAGLVREMDFRGIARSVTGVDPDPRVLENPMLDTPIIHSASRLPFDDCSFDVVVACNVVEHLSAPTNSFLEIRRVLRPGGFFFFKTPNRLHYVALSSALTPHGFHRWYNKRRGRAESDTFPTYYRANTRSSLRRIALAAGLLVDSLCVLEGRPEYLRFNPLLYLLGLIYERSVNSTPQLEDIRVVIVGAFRRPEHE